MIIMGLEGCNPCKVLKEKHPDVKYIEIPKTTVGSPKLRIIKKRLAQLGADLFPVVVNDSITEILPLEVLDK